MTHLRIEELIPIMKEVVKIMFGEKGSIKLNTFSLSNNTVKRRIVHMCDNVLEQIPTHVKESPFYSIQLNECTDILGLPQISVFIRYMNNAAVSEDLLFCKALKLHTKCEDIFQCLNDFFTEYYIPLKNCAGICTDGAAACTSFKSGVVKRINDRASNDEWTHCFLHRETLAARTAQKIKFCGKMSELDQSKAIKSAYIFVSVRPHADH